jgi:SET domain-containing protein
MTESERQTFQIRRLGRGLGFGLFSRTPFKKGEFVAEYTGRKIPSKEADALETRYLFEIDENWTIDGSPRSNTARYINHACDPNCESDVIDGRIIISAIKDIKAGEELTFDYGEEYFDEFIGPSGCKCAKCTRENVAASV